MLNLACRNRRQARHRAGEWSAVAAEEAARRARRVESSCHLAEACRGEVEHRVRREHREVAEACVAAGDEARRAIGIGERRFAVRFQARLTERTRKPFDAEQRQRNSCREQRIDERRCRRKHRPSLTGRFSRAIGQARHPCERSNRTRISELRGNRRIARQQSSPRRLAFGQFQFIGKPVFNRHTCARHSISESQHPHPSAVEHMMQRGIVDWIREPGSGIRDSGFGTGSGFGIRRFRRIRSKVLQFVASSYVGEVREQGLRRRITVEAAIGDAERPAQKSSRP